MWVVKAYDSSCGPFERSCATPEEALQVFDELCSPVGPEAWAKMFHCGQIVMEWKIARPAKRKH